jgi:hypothetical protein
MDDRPIGMFDSGFGGLTHQQPGLDREAVVAEGSEAFGRDVDLATVGAVFEV